MRGLSHRRGGERRGGLLAALLLVASTVTSRSQACGDDCVQLRSGAVFLGPPSAAKPLPSSKPSEVDDGQPRLFLIRHALDEGPALAAAVAGTGGRVVGYVPDDTLLVEAPRDAANEAAAMVGAWLAEYDGQHKLAPETVAAAAAAAPARRLRLRRRLLSGGVPAGPGGQGNGPDPDIAALLAARQELPEPLRGLQTIHRRQGLDSNQILSDSATSDPARRRRRTQAQQRRRRRLAAGPGRDLYGLSVQMVPGADPAAAREAVAAWPAQMAAAMGRAAGEACWPGVDGNGGSAQWMRFYFCEEDLQAGSEWLSVRAPVVWVEPALQPEPSNAEAQWIVQTGGLTPDQLNRPAASPRPYWAAGLRGEGQVVAATDTGLDLGHCSFLDPAHLPADVLASFSGWPPRVLMPGHRKVVQYVLPDGNDVLPDEWFADARRGHGSHVCGSIAGARATGPGAFADAEDTGAAPLARLSFFDFTNEFTGRTVALEPYDERVLPYHYEVGARISSNSWGGRTAATWSYNSWAAQFDRFAWKHADFLAVFAAGNSGANNMRPNVQAPSTSKNGLAVGCSPARPAEASTVADQSLMVFRYTDAGGERRQTTVSLTTSSGSSAWISATRGQRVPVSLASPLHACTPLTGGPYAGQFVLLDPTARACPDDTRADALVAAGAAGALWMSVDERFLADDLGPSYAAWELPYLVVTRKLGLWMKGILQDPANTLAHLTYISYPEVLVGIDGLSDFSSFGPAPDGRIKPDLIAPGQPVESVASWDGIRDGYNPNLCSRETFSQSGTSMATAQVSGHLTLMRQYFTDGFYPDGWPGSPGSTPFEPSGMLLKAAAIAGALSMEGGFAKTTANPLGAPPDMFQGWGRLHLGGSLPLPGTTAPGLRLQAAEGEAGAAGQRTALGGIVATGDGPIYAALAWHDFPGLPGAARALVNDLDLYYTLNGDPTLRRSRTDSLNTVERLELPSPAPGDRITLFVRASRLPSLLIEGDPDASLPQRWALAVVGHFEGALQGAANPAYARPPRLQAFVAEGGATLSHTLGLQAGTACLRSGPQAPGAAAGPTLLAAPAAAASGPSNTATCGPTDPGAAFELAEVRGDVSPPPGAAPVDGYLYTLRHGGSGLCVAVAGTAQGSRASLAPCDGSSAQQMALFPVSQRVAGESGSTPVLHLLVPRAQLSREPRLCLAAPAAPPGGPAALAPCDEAAPGQRHAVALLPPALQLAASWRRSSDPQDATPPDLDLVVSWASPAGGDLVLSPASPTTADSAGRHMGDNAAARPLPTATESVLWSYDAARDGQPPTAGRYRACVRSKLGKAADIVMSGLVTVTVTVSVDGQVVLQKDGTAPKPGAAWPALTRTSQPTEPSAPKPHPAAPPAFAATPTWSRHAATALALATLPHAALSCAVATILPRSSVPLSTAVPRAPFTTALAAVSSGALASQPQPIAPACAAGP
ncbi:hypothetical protein HYH03_012753 [Edaphochlamys debaryana]|uniref:Peptidase S8/S53 domain-containing protein n=1 Tax=Edaphochlamys debaryana TaxID=47281 RepID=A0A836BTV7_9CHLO|nr:hypothetical protein HYH03_012753 [Edaphochlamys debaryana]|eukprot:KAG2488755.1 hypothetical protein HYH03_012753 [Edaphochlamys debaryana]